MRHELREKLELFIRNAETIRKGINMTSGEDRRMAALLYAVNGRSMDREKVENSYAVLKKGTGVLSPFRYTTSLSAAAILSLGTDPKGTLDNAVAVYGMLRDAKFRSSEFLAMASLQIATGAEPKDHRTMVTRMRSFYDSMKAKNWIHTGTDDYILAAMFALSGADEKSAVDRIGDLYQRLKPQFASKGNVLALAQVMVIGGQTGPLAADRIITLRNVLKAKKIRLDRSYSIPTLGLLSQLQVNAEIIAQEIRDAEIFLREQEGMGPLRVSKAEIELYAAAMTAAVYSKEDESGLIAASVSTTITNILVAQMMLIIIIVAASAASVAAASG